jgi:hypothetical protein
MTTETKPGNLADAHPDAKSDVTKPHDVPVPGTELLHGRSRVAIPPHSPTAAEAAALLPDREAEEAPPTYASMAHLLPR